MKKLNKKGFTMIELLAVLVILVVIMAIAIPSVTSSIERSKQKEYDQKVKLIESEAELYIDRHSYTIGNKIGIKTLINDSKSSLRASEIVDPNNSSRTISGYVECDVNKKCTFTEDTNNNEYWINIE